eukprot:bmy_19053T0
MQKIWWQDCSPKCFVTFIEDSRKLKISIFHHQFMLTTGLLASVIKSSLKFVMSVSVCINILQFCSIAATCEMAFKISLPLFLKAK